MLRIDSSSGVVQEECRLLLVLLQAVGLFDLVIAISLLGMIGLDMSEEREAMWGRCQTGRLVLI
jgi:hypothetical protein